MREFSQIMPLSATFRMICVRIPEQIAAVPHFYSRMHDEISSPCNDICRINAETGWCEGCLRTVEEITEWRSSSDDEKREILARVAERKETTPSTPGS